MLIDDAADGGLAVRDSLAIADACLAPVLSRLRIYGVAIDADGAAYRDAMPGLPGMRRRAAAAREEREFLADDEPYRRGLD